MKTTIGALAWKEWHEHQWKLAALLAIAMGVQFACRFSLPDGGGAVEPLFIVLQLLLPLAAVFVAMGAAASERSQGTLGVLRALPVGTKRIATVKLAAGILTVFTAAFVAILFGWLEGSTVRARGQYWAVTPALFNSGNWVVDLFTWTFCCVASFVIWTAAVGVNRESEVRAGAIALVTIVAIWILFSAGREATRETTDPGVWQLISTMLPGGFLISPVREGGVVHSSALWTSFFVAHAALAARYIMHYGYTERAALWSPRPASRTASDWLNAPRRWPVTAIVWKQLRECGPVVAVGVTVSICVPMAMVVANRVRSQPGSVINPLHHIEEFAQASVVFFGMFGFLVGLVAGVGSTTTDLASRMFSFWRSRPIDVDLWFWSKYLTGLGLLLIAFGLPVFIGASMVPHYQPSDPTVMLICASIISYSTSVLAGVVLRHTIYALIVGFGLSAGIWLTAADQIEAHAQQNLVILAAAAIATIVAWLATRYDWALGR